MRRSSRAGLAVGHPGSSRSSQQTTPQFQTRFGRTPSHGLCPGAQVAPCLCPSGRRTTLRLLLWGPESSAYRAVTGGPILVELHVHCRKLRGRGPGAGATLGCAGGAHPLPEQQPERQLEREPQGRGEGATGGGAGAPSPDARSLPTVGQSLPPVGPPLPGPPHAARTPKLRLPSCLQPSVHRPWERVPGGGLGPLQAPHGASPSHSPSPSSATGTPRAASSSTRGQELGGALLLPEAQGSVSAGMEALGLQTPAGLLGMEIRRGRGVPGCTAGEPGCLPRRRASRGREEGAGA